MRGVVPGEVPTSWPAEALRAQAVAARTYAMATRKDGDGFDHYADTRSQMYPGMRAEVAEHDAAVAATAGEVVAYRGQADRDVLLLDVRRAHGERRELVPRRRAAALPDVRRRSLRRRLAAPSLDAALDARLGGPAPRRPRQGRAAPDPRAAARPLAARRARAGRRNGRDDERHRPAAAHAPGPLRHVGALHGHHRRAARAATATRRARPGRAAAARRAAAVPRRAAARRAPRPRSRCCAASRRPSPARSAAASTPRSPAPDRRRALRRRPLDPDLPDADPRRAAATAPPSPRAGCTACATPARPVPRSASADAARLRCRRASATRRRRRASARPRPRT